MVVQYDCPNCGADMVFDGDTGLLTCGSCGTSMKASEYKISDDAIEFEEINEKTNASTFEDGETNTFTCKNCGAILTTDADTSSTVCSFCGAPMTLMDRLVGDLAPAQIIPFSISKEKAEEIFKKWCKKGLITPKGFASAERIKSMTGMYVPFWLFDLNGQGQANLSCTRVRSYTRGDYIYKETSYYDVYRKVDVDYLKIPADASFKMNDETMDKLEPFYYNHLKKFELPYLSGFIAEKYNFTDKVLFNRVKARVEGYLREFINSTVTGYNTKAMTHMASAVQQREATYTLLPVWFLNYNYKGKEYPFVMNGQTGKIVGKPPLSIKKMLIWFASVFAGSFGVLELIYLIGGIL